jgi:hypothetical protein
MSFGTWRAAGALGTAALVAACATPVPVTSAALAPLATSAAAPDMWVGEAVPIRLSTGYTRTLPPQSRWRAVGRLPQGVVYQPVGTVFAIEGRQVHEAYLVLQGTALHGFYLPAEANYSPLVQPLTLPITQGAPK